MYEAFSVILKKLLVIITEAAMIVLYNNNLCDELDRKGKNMQMVINLQREKKIITQQY